jgi:hypothetical protein
MTKTSLTPVLALLTLAASLASGCVFAPREGGYREGYYDRDHHRYWHENGWHECGERDDHCR